MTSDQTEQIVARVEAVFGPMRDAQREAWVDHLLDWDDAVAAMVALRQLELTESRRPSIATFRRSYLGAIRTRQPKPTAAAIVDAVQHRQDLNDLLPMAFAAGTPEGDAHQSARRAEFLSHLEAGRRLRDRNRDRVRAGKPTFRFRDDSAPEALERLDAVEAAEAARE